MQGRKSIIDAKGPLVLEAVNRGNRVTQACDMAGVSYPAVLSWFKRGQKGEEKFASFSEAIKPHMAQKGRPLGSKNKIRETHLEIELPGAVIRMDVPDGQTVNIGSFSANAHTGRHPAEQGVTITPVTETPAEVVPEPETQSESTAPEPEQPTAEPEPESEPEAVAEPEEPEPEQVKPKRIRSRAKKAPPAPSETRELIAV